MPSVSAIIWALSCMRATILRSLSVTMCHLSTLLSGCGCYRTTVLPSVSAIMPFGHFLGWMWMLSNHSLALSLRQRLYRMVAIQGRGPKTHSSQHQHVIHTYAKAKSDTHCLYTPHRIFLCIVAARVAWSIFASSTYLKSNLKNLPLQIMVWISSMCCYRHWSVRKSADWYRQIWEGSNGNFTTRKLWGSPCQFCSDCKLSAFIPPFVVPWRTTTSCTPV